jgi:hypothetical protein
MVELQMSNTWDTLDPATKQQVASQALQGQRKSPENLNRIMEQLSQNPNMVNKLMKDAGMDVDDTTVQEGPSAEATIDDALAEESSADMQQTGKVTSDIPPAEPGEGIEEYIMRLAQMAKGQSSGIPS